MAGKKYQGQTGTDAPGIAGKMEKCQYRDKQQVAGLGQQETFYPHCLLIIIG